MKLIIVCKLCCECHNNDLLSTLPVNPDIVFKLLEHTKGDKRCNICTIEELELESKFFLMSTIRRMNDEINIST